MTKRWIWYGLFAVSLLAVLIFFLPALLSTGPGKALLAKRLGAKFKAEASIGEMHLSWLGPQTLEQISLVNPEVKGSIGRFVSEVPLWALGDMKESFQIEEGSFSFPSYQGGDIQQLQLAMKEHRFTASATTAKGGRLAANGTFFSAEDFDLVAKGKALPTMAFDELFKAKGLLYSGLGPLLDFHTNVSLHHKEGKASFELSSQNGAAFAHLEADGTSFELIEPLRLQLRIQREFGDALAHVFQFPSLAGLNSKQPISLLLSPKGFSLPYAPFNLKEMEVGDGSIDLGQIEVEKGREFLPLLEFLKKSSRRQTALVWFTPVSFQVQNGVLRLDRMDALISQSIHVCLWGDVHFVENRLDMTLGIPADTLAFAFGLKNLPESFVLHIPLRGTLEKPELVTSAASAKLAALLAFEQVPKPKNLFGGLLHAFSSQLKEESDTPPPHRPFPWER